MFLRSAGCCSPMNAFVILLLLAACEQQDNSERPTDGVAQCELAAELTALAGPDAVDCGLVANGGDPAAAYNCALAAFTSGKSFHVTFEQFGVDSVLRRAIARGADGVVRLLFYDSCPIGCGDGSHNIDQVECVQPFVLSSRSADVLACKSSANPQHVCGKFPGDVWYATNGDGTQPHIVLTVPSGQQIYPAPSADAAAGSDAASASD